MAVVRAGRSVSPRPQDDPGHEVDGETDVAAGPRADDASDRHDTAGSSALSSALATVAIGSLQYAVSISLAALIFSGPLESGAGLAAGGFVLATMVASFAIGARSRMTTVIGGAQDTAAIVAAAVAASIAADAAADAAVPTVLMMLAIASIMTGVAMWAVGHFGYASVVRFLPYPVVSGFMAGTGWLLVRGGVEVMVGRTIHLGDVGQLFEWSTARFILPGLVLALFITACAAKGVNGVVISAAILLSYLLFHVTARMLTSWKTVEDDGWLIGPFPDGASFPPLRPGDLAIIDWSVLANQALPILTIAGVSIIGLMLNLSGLEEVLGEEIDVDHEIEVAGAANVVLGLGSGLVSYHLIGDTTLARQLGVRSRVVPLAIGALGLLVLAFGSQLVAMTPRAVAGGVLFGLGLNLLVAWATGPLRRMARSDRAVTLLMLATIAGVGILSGVAAGLLMAVILFVARYSKTAPVRQLVHTNGRSNVDRSDREREILDEAPGRIIAMELQGFLFFGSVQALRDSLTERRNGDGSTAPLRHVVFDFSRVIGADSTAATSLGAGVRQLLDAGIIVSWSGLSESDERELTAAGVDLSRRFDDLDHAITAAEDEVLAAAPAGDEVRRGLRYPPDVLALAQRRTLSAGETLVDVDDPGDDVFFVSEGTLTAWTTLPDGTRRRLRRVSAGSVMGEVSFVTGGDRTATVIADDDAVVLALSRQAFEELARTNPSSAIEVQQLLLRRLAERLTDTSGALRDVLD